MGHFDRYSSVRFVLDFVLINSHSFYSTHFLVLSLSHSLTSEIFIIVRKKVETKSQEQHQNIDDLGEEEEVEDTNQETRNTLSDEETEGADHSDHEKENENTDKLKVTERVFLMALTITDQWDRPVRKCNTAVLTND